jgi:hypothetical protein
VTWTGVVWREAGPYGPDGIFVQQMRLGRHTFPVEPSVGAIVTIGSEEYRVVSVVGRFCHVEGTGHHRRLTEWRDLQTQLRWSPPHADQP